MLSSLNKGVIIAISSSSSSGVSIGKSVSC